MYIVFLEQFRDLISRLEQQQEQEAIYVLNAVRIYVLPSSQQKTCIWHVQWLHCDFFTQTLLEVQSPLEDRNNPNQSNQSLSSLQPNLYSEYSHNSDSHSYKPN